MTIRPGADWGELVAVPADLVDADSDAAMAAHIGRGDRRPTRLVGGDLLATVGGPTAGDRVRRLPIDVLRITADESTQVAVAHVVVRRSWWRGPVVAVMNVDRLGHWDVAPRAHPNDGRADVVEVAASMGVRARWQAWRRLPTGTHVPHPLIAVRRARQAEWTFERPLRLWVDGVARGPVRSLRVDVEPDAAVVHC